MNLVVLSETIERPVVKIHSFSVSVISLDLGTSATLAIQLNCISNEKESVEYRELTLKGNEYLDWGSDDTYILKIVESKLSSLL